MVIKFRKVNITNFIIDIWVLVQIIDCFSIYYKLWGYHIIQIVNIVLLLLLMFVLFEGKIRLRNKERNVITIYLLINAILFIFGDFKKLGYFTGVLIPMILTYILYSESILRKALIELYIKKFCFWITAIATISLFFFIFGTNLGIISPTGGYSASEIGWSDFSYNSYFGLYMEGQRTFFFGQTIKRNIGIFLEAPVFSYMLVTALLFELFWKEKLNKITIFILGVTIITTFSTTSLVFLLFFSFLYLYKNNKLKYIKFIVLPIGIMVVLFGGYRIVSDKLTMGNDSGAAHLSDIYTCFNAFIHNPIVGIGYNNVLGLEKYRPIHTLYRYGVSNGLPFVFACGGILLGMIFLIPIVISVLKRISKSIPFFAFLFILSQGILLMGIVVEFTLLAENFLVLCWIMALADKDKMVVFQRIK